MSDATPIPRAKRESVVPGMEEAVSTNQQNTIQRFKYNLFKFITEN